VEPEQVPQVVEAPPVEPTIPEEAAEVASVDEPVAAPTAIMPEVEMVPVTAESVTAAAEVAEKISRTLVLDEPKPAEPEGKPLRVEVEFEEEAEHIARPVVMPEVVVSDDTAKPAQAAPKVVKTPLRAWADLLIAVWLVLVASAVIASLLWRR
jgi:hypothetical protein